MEVTQAMRRSMYMCVKGQGWGREERERKRKSSRERMNTGITNSEDSRPFDLLQIHTVNIAKGKLRGAPGGGPKPR